MLKKMACCGLLLFLFFGLVTCGAILEGAKAQDLRPCVTVGEYRAVADGWSRKHVQRVFDTNGHRVAIIPGQLMSKRYRACWTDVADVFVYYQTSKGAWRVYDKDRPAF